MEKNGLIAKVKNLEEKQKEDKSALTQSIKGVKDFATQNSDEIIEINKGLDNDAESQSKGLVSHVEDLEKFEQKIIAHVEKLE